MNRLNEEYLNNIEVKVGSVAIDVIENIDIEEQIVPLVIMSGSVIDKRASYDFEGGVTFSAERDGKLEFEFFVPFTGSAQISKSMNEVNLELMLDDPINEYVIFIDDNEDEDDDGEEEDLTAEMLFELVKETEDYESEISYALPDLDELINWDSSAKKT